MNALTDRDRGQRSSSTTLGGKPLTANDAGRGRSATEAGAAKSIVKSPAARTPLTPIASDRTDGEKRSDQRQAVQKGVASTGRIAGTGNVNDRHGRTDDFRPRTPLNAQKSNPVAGHKQTGNRQDIANIQNNTTNVIVNSNSGRGSNHHSGNRGSYYGNKGSYFGNSGAYGYGNSVYGYGGFNNGYRSPYYGNNYFSLSLGYGGLGIGYGSPNFGISYFSPFYSSYRRPYCYNYSPYGSYFGSAYSSSYFGSYYGSPYGSSFYNSYYVPTPVITAPICYANALPYVSTAYDFQSSNILADDYGYGPTVASINPIVSDVALVDSSVNKPAIGPAVDEESAVDTLTDAQRFMVEAEDAFQRGDYQSSMKSAEHALLEDAENGRVLLFISQCLFAQGEFEPAISAVYQGLSLLEPADWGFVVANRDSYYLDKNAYQLQMDKLDKFITENPQAAYAFALRGYHRGFAGDKVGAAADLNKAVELENRDEFAKRLLDLFTAEPKAAAEKAEELILPPPVEDK